MIDRHVATISGLVLGMLGSLYLSYDLLGKPGGLLRRLIPAFSYGVFLAAISWLQVALLGALGLTHYFVADSVPDQVVTILVTLDHGYPWIPLLYGAILGTLAPDVNLFSAASPPPGVRGARWVRVIGLVSLFLLLVISALAYLRTANILESALIGVGAIGFVLLFLVFPVVLVPLIGIFAESLPERRLGSIGAFLTLLAFAIQLGLQLTT